MQQVKNLPSREDLQKAYYMSVAAVYARDEWMGRVLRVKYGPHCAEHLAQARAFSHNCELIVARTWDVGRSIHDLVDTEKSDSWPGDVKQRRCMTYMRLIEEYKQELNALLASHEDEKEAMRKLLE